MTVESAGTSHWDYTDKQVLHRAKGKRVILHDTIKSTGHVLRRKFLLKHVIEKKIQGMIEVRGRRGRRQAATA
jgi:hypothetical protein